MGLPNESVRGDESTLFCSVHARRDGQLHERVSQDLWYSFRGEAAREASQ